VNSEEDVMRRIAREKKEKQKTVGLLAQTV
jgi:hypothetical protein